MAFNPAYAADVGRPVNIRRDVGDALTGGLPLESPQPLTPASPEGPTTRDRIGAAASSIAGAIDPNTTSAFGQFAGGLARGFSGVDTYLRNLAGQHAAEGRQAKADQEESVLRGAQADYYKAGAEERRRPPQAPTPAADRDNWVPIPTAPGQPQRQRNSRTGETKPIVDEQGKPVMTPQRATSTPAAPRPKPTRMIDGRPYEQQPDGSWAPATVRGASTPTGAPSAAPSDVGVSQETMDALLDAVETDYPDMSPADQAKEVAKRVQQLRAPRP